MARTSIQTGNDQIIRVRFWRIFFVTAFASPILLLITSYLFGVSGWLLESTEAGMLACFLGWLLSCATAFLVGIPIRALWLGVFRVSVRHSSTDRIAACLASTASSAVAAYGGLLVLHFVGSQLESDPSSSVPSLLRLNKVAAVIFVLVAVTAVITSWIVFRDPQEAGDAA